MGSEMCIRDRKSKLGCAYRRSVGVRRARAAHRGNDEDRIDGGIDSGRIDRSTATEIACRDEGRKPTNVSPWGGERSTSFMEVAHESKIAEI